MAQKAPDVRRAFWMVLRPRRPGRKMPMGATTAATRAAVWRGAGVP